MRIHRKARSTHSPSVRREPSVLARYAVRADAGGTSQDRHRGSELTPTSGTHAPSPRLDGSRGAGAKGHVGPHLSRHARKRLVTVGALALAWGWASSLPHHAWWRIFNT